MATQIVTRVLCDFCQADEVETPGAATELVGIGGETYEVDVCEFHGKPLTELADTLSALGRKLPKSASERAKAKPSRQPSTEPSEHVCPACGAVLSFRSSLTSHARAVHGKTLDELEGKPVPYKCRAEDCGRAFSSPQGVAVHESRMHNLEPLGVGGYATTSNNDTT